MSKIDFSKPIEAVYEDGRVVKAWAGADGPPKDPTYRASVCIAGEVYDKVQQEFLFNHDGSRVYDRFPIIRNVPAVSTPTPMEFGPEIKVDGKRPEWLDGYDGPVKWWNEDQRQGVVCPDAGALNWGPYTGHKHGSVTSFALPANHFYYNLITHTYTVRPEDKAALLASDPLSRSTPDERAVAPELVSRLVELARSVADSPACTILQTVEAQNILAALEPVDEDLVEAREICAVSAISEYNDPGNRDVTLGSDLARHYRDGSYDKNSDMRRALAAIKRGPQLEKEGK